VRWDHEPAWTSQSAAATTHSTSWRKFALQSRTRQRFGVRREAKRHAALDFAHVASMKPAFPSPFGGNPKRRRRCAMPAHSTIWRNSKRCKQTAGEARHRPGMRRDSHAKSAKSAKDAKHPQLTKRTANELNSLFCLSLRALCDLCVRIPLLRSISAPRFPQEADEIPVRDQRHILLRITARL
jgi:hypothetical protein